MARDEQRLARPGSERAISAALVALEGEGFEPYREGTAVRLRNCPFHALALRPVSP